MGKKIVFLDIDGTLVNYNTGMRKPLDSTLEALNKLRENGDYYIISTARAKSYLPKEIVDLEPHGIILSNGSHIEINEEVIYNKHFSEEQLNNLIKLFKNMSGQYFVQSQEHIYVSDINNPLVKEHISLFNMPMECMRGIDTLEEDLINQICVVFKNKEDLLACEKMLSSEFIADVYMDLNNRMDILLKGSSKGHAVKFICEYLNIDFKDTYAFGNDINDIEMFKAVKYGIAMGNSEEIVKKNAYYITEDVHNDGIYNALKKYKCIE